MKERRKILNFIGQQMSQIRRQHKHEESKCKGERNAEKLIEVGH